MGAWHVAESSEKGRWREPWLCVDSDSERNAHLSRMSLSNVHVSTHLSPVKVQVPIRRVRVGAWEPAFRTHTQLLAVLLSRESTQIVRISSVYLTKRWPQLGDVLRDPDILLLCQGFSSVAHADSSFSYLPPHGPRMSTAIPDTTLGFRARRGKGRRQERPT